MRILFLSNFFPPARPGGYTQWCHEVSEGLKARGHTIAVLTSRHERQKAPATELDIHRLLYLEGDLAFYQMGHFFTKWTKQHRENLQNLRQSIDTFRPDVLFVWGMWALSKALPALAEELLPGRVVYYLSDYWPMARDMHTTYWQTPPRRAIMRLPKWALRFVAEKMLAHHHHAALQFANAICVSHAVKRKLVQAGLPLQTARVIHGGTDVTRFRDEGNQLAFTANGCLKLLYAGQLVEHKGVHTAIEAMALLTNESQAHQAHLTIIGSGHPDYEARLRRMVAGRQLFGYVQFRKQVTPSNIPDILRKHHVLLFTSIYDEPLARMTQEALAAGMVVIGTTTGGTAEILTDGENGLTFAAGDAASLARQIQRLMLEPELGDRLAETGRQRVLNDFTLERMTGEIEETLKATVRDAPPRTRARST